MIFCQDVDADTGDLRLLLCFRAACKRFRWSSGIAPIFGIVREYPRTKSKLRAHQMALSRSRRALELMDAGSL